MRARWQLSKRQTHAGVYSSPCFFSVFVLCGARYVLTRFPFLLPRVTLSQEITGPLVQWRTGGGIAQLVSHYDGKGTRSVLRSDAPTGSAALVSPSTERGFRAYWIGTERCAATAPGSSVSALCSKRIVVLFVHGGGFALGSVALYAEPLLRVLGHVHTMSQGAVQAECVALEYDLAPAARFPTQLLQALRCYAHLVEVEHIPAEQIVLCGDSAGGGLVLSMLLCLANQAQGDPYVAERDWGALPMPGRAVLISPMVDVRPQDALVFAGLRQQASAPDPRTRRALVRRQLALGVPGALDYLAPEALLHYAQLYTGVLERPRRAQGPATTLCAYLAALRPQPGLLAPVQTLAHYVLRTLTHPLLPSRVARRQQTEAVPCYTSTRAAVLSLGDAESDAVLPPGPLYRISALLSVCGVQQELLARHPLVNPGLGDWSKVHLAHGLFVTWGRNEVLSGDIEAWAARLQLTWASQGRAPGVELYAESGAGGVHVWPFVSMYLAARQTERERGLRMLAHALLGPLAPAAGAPHGEKGAAEDEGAWAEEGGQSSPASMPSDLEEDNVVDRAAQAAWEQELLRMGLRT